MRKLVCAASGYTLALILAHYLLPEGWLPYCACACAVLALCAVPLRGRARLTALLLTLSAAAGFGWTAAYGALFIAPAERCAGQTMTVSARVLDYPELFGDYSRVEVRLTEEGLPGCRVLVCDYAGGLEELRPGDTVRMELSFRSAREFFGEESDRYLAAGIHLRGTLTGDCQVTGRWDWSFLCFPKELARRIRESGDRCFPEDVAPLMKALLTGDKTDYYQDDALYTAMQAAGFSHIVAVSGMHVAFLVSVLSLGTGRRRATAYIGIPLIGVFAAMVGFTPSVVRAGLMQALLLLAPLLRRENDPPTSLAAALLLLLVWNPESIGSLSLQLSFAAMAGILLVSPRVYDLLTRDEKDRFRFRGRVSGRILRALCNLLSSSLGALVFTVPLAALHFGTVALYAPLTNLLCLWAMSAAFVLGYAVCLAGMLLPVLGGALGWLTAWLPRYVIFVVRHVARLPWAVLYMENGLAALWLAYVYAVFLAAYLGRGKERFRPVIPACLCVMGLCLVVLLSGGGREDALTVTAVDVGQGQSVAVLTGGGTVVIDCGGTGTAENAGDAAASYLMSRSRGRVDLLVLTHLHADHANGVERLMNRVEVERLALPENCGDDGYYDEIMACCRDHGTQVYVIGENTDVTVDGLSLTLYAPLGSDSINERGLLVYGDYGDFEFLVTGDAASGVEKLLVSLYDLGDIELLVAGHHGSKYSTCDELLEAVEPDVAFISVGPNSYGHPTEEALARLAEHGVETLRTDESGNLSLTVGNEYG